MKVDKNIKNIVRNSVWTIAISLALISCTQQNVEEKNPEVFYFGALKKIMNGELKAHFDLGDLKNLDHVYALGAEERLKGEIQIFNGESMFSSVK